MRHTLDRSIKDLNYSDICVSAPQGLENEDIEIIENQDGLKEIEYAYDCDLSIKGRTEIIKVMNMPLNINMPKIIEGKEPERGEILLDDSMKKLSYKIGDIIIFKKEVNKIKDKDEEDALSTYTYKVSGFCQSLDYIMYRTRGYSERGLGEIEGFAYINKDEFKSDPTIAKLKYQGSDKFQTSEKKYRSFIAEKYQALKIDMKYRPSNRLKRIKGNLSNDIDKGEKEIIDAKDKLDSAYEKILQGQDDLKKGKNEYSKGLSEFEEEKKKGQDKLDESRNKLYKAKNDLNKADKDLKNNQGKLNEGKVKLADAKKEINEKKEELNKGYREYESGKGELKAGEEALVEGEKQLAEGRKKLDDGWKKIEESTAKLEDAKIQYANGLKEYEDGKIKLEEGKGKVVDSLSKIGINNVTYDEASSLIIALSSALDKAGPIIEKIKTLDQQISILENKVSDLENKKAQKEEEITACEQEINNETDPQKRQELTDKLIALKSEEASIEAELLKARAELDQAKKLKENLNAAMGEISNLIPGIGPNFDIDNMKSKLKEAKDGIDAIKANEDKLIEAKAKLDGAKSQIEEGEKQLQEGIYEAEKGEYEYSQNEEKIRENRRKIEQGKEELEKTKSQLDDGDKKLKEGEKDLARGQSEYEDNYEKFVEGKAKFESGKEKYVEGEKQLKEGQESFDEEIKKGQDKLISAKNKLYKGEKDLAKGQKEYKEKSEDAKEKIAKAEDDINKGKKYLSIIKEPRYTITPRYLSEGINTYIDYSNRIDGLSLVFPIFFFAIALLVSFTTMTRMVDEERTIIGTYKALGYTNKDISYKYFLYGSIASIVGGIIGAFSGSYILTYIIGNSYSTETIFEDKLIIKSYPLKIAFAIIVGFLFTALAAKLTTNKTLRENTANLLRPKVPKSGNRILLEKVPFIWSKMSFLFKITARNIFRSKKRMFMTVTGIIGCSALLILGFGIKGSVANIERLQFSEILKYDLAISYDKDIDEDNFIDYKKFINNLDADHGEFYQEQFTVEYPKIDQTVNMVVPANINGFEKFFLLRDPKTAKEINIEGRGAVISKKLSKLLKIKKGDILRIKDAYDNYFEVEIKDICEMYITHYLFLDRDYYEKVKGEKFTANTDFIKNTKNLDMEKLKNDSVKYKVVTSTVGVDFFKEALNQFLYAIKKVEGVVVVLSSLLAIVVLYNLTNINIEERQREIATIKVLGFYAKETTAYIYRETFILTFIGIIIGLFVGKILHYFVLQIVVPYYVMLSEHLVLRAYIYSTIITVLVTIFIMIVFHYKLKKIDMVESLKSNE